MFFFLFFIIDSLCCTINASLVSRYVAERFAFYFTCRRLSWAQRGETPTVHWKETKPKVSLPSSSSGAGVQCLLIFQFDEHDKFIKIALAVNHSSREEVVTTTPKDIVLFLRLLWPINNMGQSTEYIHNKMNNLLFTLEWVIFTILSQFDFFFFFRWSA